MTQKVNKEIEHVTSHQTQFCSPCRSDSHKSKTLVSNGSVMLGLDSSPIAGDRFDEKRVGLDHLSFQVAHRVDLETAAAYFDENNIDHGEITDLTGFGISILAFHDPDNIALEFTAPYSE